MDKYVPADRYIYKLVMSNGMAIGIGTSPEHQDFCRWDLVLLDFARRCTWYDNMWHLCRQSKTPWCGSERVWLNWLSWLSFLCFQLFVQAETFFWNDKLEFCWFPSTKEYQRLAQDSGRRGEILASGGGANEGRNHLTSHRHWQPPMGRAPPLDMF